MYISEIMHLHVPVGWMEYVALATLVSGVIAQRTYSTFNYAVFPAQSLSIGAIAVTIFAVLTYALGSRVLTPAHGIDSLYVALGLPLGILIFAHDRYRRSR